MSFFDDLVDVVTALSPVGVIAKAIDGTPPEETIVKGADVVLRPPKPQLFTSTEFIERGSWMSDLADKKIHEIIMPGTHDTATYRFDEVISPPMLQKYAQAQQFSVLQQLKAGIRYLDIRLKNGLLNEKIYCGHKYFTVPWNEVLDDIVEFLADQGHRREVIVLAVTDDDGTAQLQAAKAEADRVLGSMVRHSISADETLRAMTKDGPKIIYVDNTSCDGIRIDNSWDKTASPDPVEVVDRCIEYACQRTRQAGTLNLIALESTIWTNGDVGRFNTIAQEFFSTYGNGLEDFATYTNAAVLYKFLENPRAVAGSNVINMDFANDQVIGKVIDLNYQ